MTYIGDYKEDDTVLVMFNTFTSNDPSASCTITDFVNTDVHIHKEDDLTQRNNAAGITVSKDFDGITGSHMIKIDTNDNTVAGFWVAAKDYFVRIEGTTVDGATLNVVVAHFSIENRYTRGTESAYTGTPPTVVQIRTEMDANSTKMAPSQTLNDYKATGFSTHDAAAVKTAMEAAGSKLTLTLEDTADMQPNQGAWATAVGFSTHSAADVKTAIEAAGSKITLIKDKTDNIPASPAPANEYDTQMGYIPSNLPDVPTAAELNTAHGAGNWEGGGAAPTVGEIRTEMEGVGTKLTAVKDKTDNLPASPAPANEYDTQMGYIPSDLGSVNTAAQDDTDHGAGSWEGGGAAPTVGEIRTEMEAAGSKLTLTLEDTDNLQGNQGAWATAVGFSTHSAANVWSVGTRALTDKAGFALSTAGIKAIWDQLTSALTTAGSIGKLLVDNINATISSRNSTTPPTVIAIRQEMDANSTKMAPSQSLADYKATGFSTHSAENVRTEMDANSTKMAPSQSLADYKATGFATSAALTTHDGKLDAVDTIVKRILGLEHENAFIDNTTYSGAHMTGARVRIYSVAGSVGTASDVIATYTMTATYTGDEMDDYKVVKA